MYYNVLACITMCSHVLSCITMYCHVLQCIVVYSHVLPRGHIFIDYLKCHQVHTRLPQSKKCGQNFSIRYSLAMGYGVERQSAKY